MTWFHVEYWEWDLGDCAAVVHRVAPQMYQWHVTQIGRPIVKGTSKTLEAAKDACSEILNARNNH